MPSCKKKNSKGKDFFDDKYFIFREELKKQWKIQVEEKKL